MRKGVARELVLFMPIIIFVVFAIILYYFFGDQLGRAIVDSIKYIIRIVEVR